VEPDQLKAFIQNCALKLGFSAVGISRVRPIPPEAMTGWLDRNYHGQMSYMERNLEKRLDPRKIFPDVRSIVSVSLNYLYPIEMPYSDSDQGVISRYARGTDYHLVLEERLAQLLRDLTVVEPETVGKVYVDTGPVMDKYWAVESGLGWMGKHTNVLSRSNGSWFFLGEILLSLDLEPDAPEKDFCGSCTRCLDACPTKAIVEPYVLDARKCLSYSTIELKEDVPCDLRGPTGNLVFGCDFCQDVCPWNRRAPDSREGEFMDPGRDYTLRGLARLSTEQFNHSFRHSSVKRTKWRGLMRNVAVAMGNSRSEDMIPELTELLRCEDSMVRRHAGWALQKIKG
jgi:epoxyqueuosine reductase